MNYGRNHVRQNLHVWLRFTSAQEGVASWRGDQLRRAVSTSMRVRRGLAAATATPGSGDVVTAEGIAIMVPNTRLSVVAGTEVRATPNYKPNGTTLFIAGERHERKVAHEVVTKLTRRAIIDRAHHVLDGFRLPGLDASDVILNESSWRLLAEIDEVQAALAGAELWKEPASVRKVARRLTPLKDSAGTMGLPVIASRLADLQRSILESVDEYTRHVDTE